MKGRISNQPFVAGDFLRLRRWSKENLPGPVRVKGLIYLASPLFTVFFFGFLRMCVTK